MIAMKILVLMSTYNGECYLSEQIDSVLSQEGVEVHLLIRDDGSKDSTRKILDEYSRSYTNIEVLKADNVGFVKSFSTLVNIAVSQYSHFDFYAFCDQDDIWMPNKLKIACDFLSLKDDSLPNLFTSNSIFVDSDKTQLRLFHKGGIPQFRQGSILIYSTEQGCSMVFNRKAAEIYSTHSPQKTWHDRWMYYICFYFGSVSYYHKPLFLYRIHSGNALGNIGPQMRFASVKELRNPHSVHLEMAEEFYSSFNIELSDSYKKIIKKYLTYRKKIHSKLSLVFSKEFAYPEKDINKQLVAIVRILFNKA